MEITELTPEEKEMNTSMAQFNMLTNLDQNHKYISEK